MRIFQIALAAAALSCSPAAVFADEGLPSSHAMVDAAVVFPEVNQATRREGAFVSPHHVLMVTDGMTKKQIYTLLDLPHFTEGMFGVKRWNYILNFYTGQNSEYKSCQYQIQFDQKYRVSGTYWRDAECASLVERLLANADPVVKKAVTVSEPLKYHVQIRFD